MQSSCLSELNVNGPQILWHLITLTSKVPPGTRPPVKSRHWPPGLGKCPFGLCSPSTGPETEKHLELLKINSRPLPKAVFLRSANNHHPLTLTPNQSLRAGLQSYILTSTSEVVHMFRQVWEMLHKAVRICTGCSPRENWCVRSVNTIRLRLDNLNVSPPGI